MKVQKPTNIRKYLKDQEKTNKVYLYKTKGNICKPNLNWKLCSTTRFFNSSSLIPMGFSNFKLKQIKEMFVTFCDYGDSGEWLLPRKLFFIGPLVGGVPYESKHEIWGYKFNDFWLSM